MPLPASFSVGPQHAQPDENTGYNTQPAFVIPGSKAAERNARRKKGSIPVLEMVPNRLWEASGSIQPQYSAPHGLMTPEMPDSFTMDVDSGNYYRLGQARPRWSARIERSCISRGTILPWLTAQHTRELRRHIVRSDAPSSRR